MAKSSADDAELRRACEAAIEGTKQSILMSIRVAKSRGIFGKSGKLGRQMAEARVLAISTKSKGQRTKAFLRVLKYSTGGVLEPAKLYKLKHLSKLEVIANDPSGCTFMLGFDNLRSQSVSPPQWTMRNIDDRNRLLLCIFNMCKDVLGRLPKVVGIDVVEMALWAKDNLQRRGFSLANSCPFCICHPESTNHMLLHCSWADKLWEIAWNIAGVHWVRNKGVKDELLAWEELGTRGALLLAILLTL